MGMCSKTGHGERGIKNASDKLMGIGGRGGKRGIKMETGKEEENRA